MPSSSLLGPIALLGSGETSLSAGRIFESLAQSLPTPLCIVILETPAGFELNSSQVAGRVADFLRTRLGNYDPGVTVLPARKRGTPFSPDNAELLAPLLSANLIFMGPGSPTYAVRQLRGSLAWDILRVRQRMGAALVFASAATIAVGARALPVYEIYKVGEDMSAPPGLDLFADFGLPLSFIPHWNNAEGGAEVDTSRCFVGMERFDEWRALLPPGHTTVGLDEHTGLIFDFALAQCRVSGVSSVTLLRECNPKIYPAGATFSFAELGEFHLPVLPEESIPASTWKMVMDAASTGRENGEIPAEVHRLTEARQQARLSKDWAAADDFRQQIESLGWRVEDTPTGPKLFSKRGDSSELSRQ
jgi:hypothetical protein